MKSGKNSKISSQPSAFSHQENLINDRRRQNRQDRKEKKVRLRSAPNLISISIIAIGMGVHRQIWRDYFPCWIIELGWKLGRCGVDKNARKREEGLLHETDRGNGQKNLYNGVHGVTQGKGCRIFTVIYFYCAGAEEWMWELGRPSGTCIIFVTLPSAEALG